MNIAVTGLNATDNPGPGVPVIRSLKDGPDFSGRIIGLVYDILEPGVFMEDLADRCYLIPYPSTGLDSVYDRIAYIHERERLDLILPTLDTELYVFYKLMGRLAELGIRTFLPSTEQLHLRGKDKLAAFCKENSIPAPKTRLVNTAQDLHGHEKELPYPVMIKGIFYGAQAAGNLEESLACFYRARAQWGLPVIMQEQLQGDEFNVVALGDGAGGTVGAVAMRKTYITDKGKGWAGVTIFDPALIDLSRRVIAKLKWAGGMELEFIKARRTGEYYLLEINPRFPAWTYLATAAGQNLPGAWTKLAQGLPVEPFGDYEVGKMFVRCSWDLISDVRRLETWVTAGEA